MDFWFPIIASSFGKNFYCSNSSKKYKTLVISFSNLSSDVIHSLRLFQHYMSWILGNNKRSIFSSNLQKKKKRVLIGNSKVTPFLSLGVEVFRVWCRCVAPIETDNFHLSTFFDSLSVFEISKNSLKCHTLYKEWLFYWLLKLWHYSHFS